MQRKNNLTVPTDRDYHLLLDVERVRAQGFKLGYNWRFNDKLSFDFAGTYYYNLSDLQSGKAEIFGDLDPLDDDLLAEAQVIIDGLDGQIET
ncbi:MAG: hypothetical protein VB957_19680 [Pseudomonadales bacterium]|jgi:hypothetical protein